jgi:cobalt/nickel transport system permease protein
MLLAMHIPDGFLNPLAAGTWGTWLIAGVAIAYSLRRLNDEIGGRLVPLLGVTSAGIFAAQMVNFPLIGLQASGHLMGGVLAAVVLGPWGSIVALSAVLVVQCLLYADGGLTALGANITNMAVIGGGLGYLIYAPLRRFWPGPRGTVFAAIVASWLIIPVAALGFVVEFSAGSQISVPLERMTTLMLFYHVLIGLGEAAITGLVVSWLVRTRPDLIYYPAPIDRPLQAGTGDNDGTTGSRRRFARPIEHFGQTIGAALVVSLAVAALLAPWASEDADGLEKVAHSLGIADLATAIPWAPFPDYDLPSASNTTAPPALAGVLQRAGMVTSVLGLSGTLVTFAFAALVASCARWSPGREA